MEAVPTPPSTGQVHVSHTAEQSLGVVGGEGEGPVGESVGLSVGESVGLSVGESVGESVGLSVGESVGLSVGESVGAVGSVGGSVGKGQQSAATSVLHSGTGVV